MIINKQQKAKRALVKAENDYEKAKLLLQTNEVPSVKRILIQLRQFFSLLSAGKESSVSTKDLTDAFGWVSREVSVQHDAHELNRILVDAIERSLKGTKNESLINEIYQGQMVSRTLCLKCEYCSERKENFLDAIVQIKGLKNLSESLSSQCKSEYLVGDNKYLCDKCNAKVDAKRSVAYVKLPNVLTLALNRFVFNYYTLNREKCNDRFEFPLVFDFEPFLDEKLSKEQTHRTKEDEELLKKANEEYEKEKKQKEEAKQKRLKEEEERKKRKEEEKTNKANKAPLAIEAPPGVMETKITSGIAPMACAVVPDSNNNTAWRGGIPRSRSEEDDDLQRALAASIGQTYIPPKRPHRSQRSSSSDNSNRISGIDNNFHSMNTPKYTTEEFVEQPEVTYEEAVDMLMNKDCCFGLYDFKIKQWRTAIYIRQFDNNRRLSVRYISESSKGMHHPNMNAEKFCTIMKFPAKCIQSDPTRFKANLRDLKDQASLPKEKIEAWSKRQKDKNYQKELKEREKKAAKEKKEREKKEKEKKEKLEKEKKEKEKKAKEQKAKEEKEKKEKEAQQKKKENVQNIEDTKEESKPIIKDEEGNEIKKDADDGHDEDTKEKEEVIEDWSKKTDFSDVTGIGYLCDDGEVAVGDFIKTNKDKTQIFIHFNNDGLHYGKKYGWIDIPNDRLSPPPKNRPKKKFMLGVPEEMTTFAMSPNTHQYNMYDHGSRDETSVMQGRNGGSYNRSSPAWKLCESEINLESNHLYALTGVVIHRGTPHAGHYHAYLKDFIKEGKYQKKATTKKEKDFVKNVSESSLWYDFNDSSVYRIRTNQVAKQYGGRDECAYMLVYRKINKETAIELMKEPKLTVPDDLMEYVKKANFKIEQERLEQEAKANQMKIQIVDPRCFSIKDGKLSMNPFIESLLKKIIRLSRDKIKINKVIEKSNNNGNGADKNEEDKEEPKSEEERQKEQEMEEKEIEKIYEEQSWDQITNMRSFDIVTIVSEHYKQNSIFVTCDGRDSVDTLLPSICEEIKKQSVESTQLNVDNIKLHFLSIPPAFEDENISCQSISKLLDQNFAANVDDRIFPIHTKSKKDGGDETKDKVNEESDDEYPYEKMPTKIRQLPFKKLDFIMNSRACFVWNNADINGTAFNLKVSRTVSINIRFFSGGDGVDDEIVSFFEQSIAVPLNASLHEIWTEIQSKLSESAPKIKDIKVPVFTLMSSANKDTPDIIYFGNDGSGKYDDTFYSKPKFAKLLHHKINPMQRWRSQKYKNSNKGRKGQRPRSNSDPESRRFDHDALMAANQYGPMNRGQVRGEAFSQRHTIYGDIILCVEDSVNLPQPQHDSRASQKWHESTKFCTISVEDYTQVKQAVVDEKEEKDEKEINYDEIGSSNNPNVEKRNLVWKIPRPTSLRDFFQIARKKLKISDEADVRVFSTSDDQRYLINFPHRFALPRHNIMIERGRYPAFQEVFLMTTIIHSDNTTKQYLPVIIQNSKSVKFLKQRIMKLFHLNPDDYKKYVCYNITTGTDNKDKCWRDQLTLNSHAVNPRNGDRVGIQIGVDTINKKVCIMQDTRILTEPWNMTASLTDASMTASGQGLNPYISSDLGTISISGDATYDDLRKQIHGMEQIKNDVPSYKHLLLSWVDFVYQIPLSFPMLKSGKLAGQKNFNSAMKKLCVEVLPEELQGVDKNCRCPHIYLAKIEKLDDKPVATETSVKETENDKNETEKEENANKNDSESSYIFKYFCFYAL